MVEQERLLQSELDVIENQQNRCTASGWRTAMIRVRQHVIG